VSLASVNLQNRQSPNNAPIIAPPLAVGALVTGDCTGFTATAQVAGGVAPYNYVWSTGATTPNVTGLTPNQVVTVVVIDSTGRHGSATFVIPNINCCNNTEVNITGLCC
jgi:hypothetical protein